MSFILSLSSIPSWKHCWIFSSCGRSITFPLCRLRLRPHLSEYFNISKNCSQARLHLASATVIIRLQRHLTTRIKFLCCFSSTELTLAGMTHCVGFLFISRRERVERHEQGTRTIISVILNHSLEEYPTDHRAETPASLHSQ